MLSFFTLIIIIKNLVASLFFFRNFFKLFFLKIYSFQSSYDTLPSSFDFLYDSDSSLHVSIKCSSLFDYLLLRKCSFLKIKKELLDDLISFLFIWVFISFEISWDSHLYFGWPDSHLKKKLIEIDILWTYRVGGSVVPDEIKLELNDSEHSRLEHILEQHSFLGMNELIVTVLQYFVTMNVLDVQMCIKTEPLFILTLV